MRLRPGDVDPDENLARAAHARYDARLAWQVASEVHMRAAHARDAFGRDDRIACCQGSMSASIEPEG